MDIRQAIRSSLTASDFVVGAYLADLTPAEMLARPVPGVNHIAWQLGHLIKADRHLVEQCCAALGRAELGRESVFGPLPAGFAERHTKETAGSDNPADFLTKEEYLAIKEQVRGDILRLVEKLEPADFDQPVTKVPPFLKTVGETLNFLGGHWLMHAGQWTVTRRHLGRPPLF
jgi:hypothetical protein